MATIRCVAILDDAQLTCDAERIATTTYNLRLLVGEGAVANGDILGSAIYVYETHTEVLTRNIAYPAVLCLVDCNGTPAVIFVGIVGILASE